MSLPASASQPRLPSSPTHTLSLVQPRLPPPLPISLRPPPQADKHDRPSGPPEQAGILHTIFFHRYFPTLSPRTHEVLDLTLPYVAEPELETLIDQRTAALVHELDATSSSKTGASVPAPTPASAVPPSISAASAVGANTTTPASLSTSPAAPSSPSRSPARKAQHQHHQSLPQQGRAALAGLLGAAAGVGEKRSSGGGGGGGRGQVSVQFMEKTTSRRRKMWGRADEEVCWEVWTVRVTVAEPRTESGESWAPSFLSSFMSRDVVSFTSSWRG